MCSLCVCACLGGYTLSGLYACHSACVEIRTKSRCFWQCSQCCTMWFHWGPGSELKIHALTQHGPSYQQCQQSCLKNTGSDWEDCGLWTAVLFLYNKISAFIKHNLWKSKKFLILFYHNSVACQHQITTSLGCIKLECFIFKTALWND